MPERHLNKFFESLKTPYRAFEAEKRQGGRGRHRRNRTA